MHYLRPNNTHKLFIEADERCSGKTDRQEEFSIVDMHMPTLGYVSSDTFVERVMVMYGQKPDLLDVARSSD